jgi:hypothetical protein
MRPNPRSHILKCDTYEDKPGWGENTWKEECAANGGAQQVSGHELHAASSSGRHRWLDLSCRRADSTSRRTFCSP